MKNRYLFDAIRALTVIAIALHAFAPIPTSIPRDTFTVLSKTPAKRTPQPEWQNRCFVSYSEQ